MEIPKGRQSGCQGIIAVGVGPCVGVAHVSPSIEGWGPERGAKREGRAIPVGRGTFFGDGLTKDGSCRKGRHGKGENKYEIWPAHNHLSWRQPIFGCSS